MFPHVSVEDIAADLASTGNFDMTVDNLLSGRAVGAAGLGAVRDAPRAAGAAAAAAPAAPPLHEAVARQAPPVAGQDVLEAQDVAALMAEGAAPAAAPAAAAAGPPSAAHDAAVEAPHEPWPRVGDDW